MPTLGRLLNPVLSLEASERSRLVEDHNVLLAVFSGPFLNMYILSNPTIPLLSHSLWQFYIYTLYPPSYTTCVAHALYPEYHDGFRLGIERPI